MWYAGNKFQRVEPETEKARALNLVLIRGIYLFVLFDRRYFTESAEKKYDS